MNILKKYTNNSQSNFFSSILITVTTWTIIIVLVLSAVLYTAFENISLSLIQLSLKDNLNHIKYNTKAMVNSAKILSTQLILDENISKLYYKQEPNVFDKQVAIKQMDLYKSATPNINSIYLFNSKTNMFYTSSIYNTSYNVDDFFDKGIINILKNTSQDNNFKIIPRKIETPIMLSSESHPTFVYTYIMPGGRANTLNKDDRVIVNISQAWVSDMIKEVYPNSDSNVMIVDKNGFTVFGGNKHENLEDLSSTTYVSKILSNKLEWGYFIDNVNGKKSYITYIIPKDDNWCYLLVNPYNNISDKINNLRQTTAAICGVIFLLGLILSIIISKKLYKPFQKVLTELNKSNKSTNIVLEQKKHEFLCDIILGKVDYTPAQLTKKLKQFDINLNNEKCVVILFRLDNFSDFCDKYNSKDRTLLKYGIQNISYELFSEEHKTITVNLSKEDIVIIIDIDSDSNPSINNTIKKIQQAVMQHLEISLSVSTTGIATNFININESYISAFELLRYRLYFTKNCIIFPQIINSLLNPKSNDISHLEKTLIDYLLLGKIQDTIIILEEIISTIRWQPIEEFESTMVKLVVSISNSIATLQKNNNILLDFSINDVISKINKFDTLEEISDYLVQFFKEIDEKTSQTKNLRYYTLVQNATDIINNDFANVNLSLESIANSLGLSGNYLGRLFKQYTGKSLAEVINDVRLDKAGELLLSNNYTLNEIIERTGFTNVSYFCTLFKKKHGVTPNEFRKNSSVKA